MNVETSRTVYEVLKGAYLYPRPMAPVDLIRLMMRLFNGKAPDQVRYDDAIPIRKQMILSETPIKTQWDRMEIGTRHFRCMTPRPCPNRSTGFCSIT
ncbi:MAG: TraC family protein [Desulfobacterales bacterium]